MGIFGFLKKSKPEAKREIKRFEHDKAKYQWNSAAQEYCRQTGRDMDALEEVDHEIIWEYAGNHIAYFLTWLIQNGFYVPPEDFPDLAEAAEAVRREELRGVEFLMSCCDGVLSRDELSPEIQDFADWYYEPDYLNSYSYFMEDELHKPALGSEFSWEDYHAIAPMIDAAYQGYKKQGNR